MIKNITLFIVLLLTLMLFKNYSLVTENIIAACELFLSKIFPSLFPMFVISSILINLNIIKYLNFFFQRINSKLFKINENTSYILFMSIISGFPSNAKIAKEMYELKYIEKEDVQKIILFSHFSNPLFILSMIKHKTILVLVAHYIANFIIGFVVRNKYLTNNKKKEQNKIVLNLPQIITRAITQAMNTLLFILGCIVTFYIISSLLDIPLLNIILELSQGLNYINNLNISLKLQTILLGSLLSFGGICIHFQVYGIISELKVSYYPYLLARIFHAVITGVIILIFY